MLQVQRPDKISENTKYILNGVRNRLKTVESKKAQSENPTNQIKLSSNKVMLKDALDSDLFTYHGKGIYKDAGSDTEFGKVWVKKTITNDNGEKEEWLVTYTTDEDDVARAVASNALVEELGKISKTAQEDIVDVPLAPGIKSKSINIDEKGGEAGTGTVSIEFTDPNTAWDFYQNQVGTAPMQPVQQPVAQPPVEEDQEPMAFEQQPEQPQVPPATSRLTPSVLVKQGSQYARILKQVLANGVRYSFVDEDGKVVVLSNTDDNLVVGNRFIRPDTGENARVLSCYEMRYALKDDIADALVRTGAAPEGWENTVKKMKRDSDVDNPWALAWWHANEGHKPGGKDEKKSNLMPIDFLKAGDTVQKSGEQQQYKVSAANQYGAHINVDGNTVFASYGDLDDGGFMKVGMDWTAAARKMWQEGRSRKEIFDELWNIWYDDPEDDPEAVRNLAAKNIDSFLDNLEQIKWKKEDQFRAGSINKKSQDVADEIPPMGWTEQSEVEHPVGAGDPLPPQQDLKDDVIYDTEEDTGKQFQMSVLPEQDEVRIKVLDSEEQEVLDQAVQERQQQMQQQQQQQTRGPGMGEEFGDAEVPIEF